MSWLCNIFDLFLSPWIRIPNTDSDPEDPWIRIRNTGYINTSIAKISCHSSCRTHGYAMCIGTRVRGRRRTCSPTCPRRRGRTSPTRPRRWSGKYTTGTWYLVPVPHSLDSTQSLLAGGGVCAGLSTKNHLSILVFNFVRVHFSLR